MAQTNDEIKKKYVLRLTGEIIPEKALNEARLAERVSLVYEIESGCLSYIPRKMKTKREEEISSEGYVHGVKSALEVIKNSNPADIFDWNKIIKGERLAALDDIKPCIKAFENLLNAIQEDAAETECCKFNIKGEDSMCEIHSAFKKADKALAELEALRKKAST